MYIVLLVDNCETSASGCEEFWLINLKFDLFWFVGHFHACPPKLPVAQLEQHRVLADVKIYYFLVFITLTNDFSGEVHSFIDLDSNFGLDSHLTGLVTTPSVQFSITEQGNWIAFAGLDFFDGYVLLVLQILEVFVDSWKTVVLVFAISKSSVFPVAPVVCISLIVNDCIELATSSDTFDLFSFECTDFGWFQAGHMSTMTEWAGGVHEEVHEHTAILTAIPERVDLAIFVKDKGMLFATYCVLALDVVLLEVLNQLGCFNLALMTVSALSVLIISKRIDFACITWKSTLCRWWSLYAEDRSILWELIREGRSDGWQIPSTKWRGGPIGDWIWRVFFVIGS